MDWKWTYSGEVHPCYPLTLARSILVIIAAKGGNKFIFGLPVAPFGALGALGTLGRLGTLGGLGTLGTLTAIVNAVVMAIEYSRPVFGLNTPDSTSRGSGRDGGMTNQNKNEDRSNILHRLLLFVFVNLLQAFVFKGPV